LDKKEKDMLKIEIREFTEKFKKQMVSLYNNRKARSEIISKYELTSSAFANWIKKYKIYKSIFFIFLIYVNS